jgi:NitT/TauT family transport system substrate-binding protein
MKKLALLLVLVMTGFTLFLTGCNKKNDNLIRVSEVTHSIFYAPLYIAINKGFFAEEGLEIELTNGGGADKCMTALTSNSADIALMGPEATIYVVEQGKKDQPKVFAQLTKRDGSFIIGRENIENFTLADMEGKEIIGGRRGGVPAMTLEYALKNAGLINGQNITINYDVAFDNMTAAFIGGTGDFVTAFEPSASAIADSGNGYILGSVGALAGEVPYTAFTANESYLTNNPEKINKFLRAIIKGYNFLITASIDDVVEALAPSFLGTSTDSIKKATLNYIAIDAWVDNPAMKSTAYNNLITIMMNAGELTQSVDFNKVIDNTYAQKAYNEIKASLN